MTNKVFPLCQWLQIWNKYYYYIILAWITHTSFMYLYVWFQDNRQLGWTTLFLSGMWVGLTMSILLWTTEEELCFLQSQFSCASVRIQQSGFDSMKWCSTEFCSCRKLFCYSVSSNSSCQSRILHVRFVSEPGYTRVCSTRNQMFWSGWCCWQMIYQV